jgi:beta-glucosidase
MRRHDFLTVPQGPDDFIWATGIEDTFITDPWPATGRTLEEYELTQHYDHWREDVGLIATLGLGAARYGIPWYRVNPAPGEFDWRWTDEVIPALVATGVEPIIDLVHYGTPAWLLDSFLNPDYPERAAEYAGAFAKRYRELLRWYTPLNEPRVTAWYAGRIGLWPPYRRGWSGFTEVLLQLCRGIVLTEAALRAALPEVVLVHVDATDLYQSDDPALAEEVRHRQELVFLGLDLVQARVDSRHPLMPWLRRRGVADADLQWFQEHRCTPHLIGINEYPLFSWKQLSRTTRGIRTRMPYAPADVLATLSEMYVDRYGLPVLITETASAGTVARRAAWMDDSIVAVAGLRQRGVPVVGYTWWPLFALVAWSYRTGTKPLEEYLVSMGLWELEADAEGDLWRVATSLIDRYQGYVRGGASAVGSLASRRNRAATSGLGSAQTGYH